MCVAIVCVNGVALDDGIKTGGSASDRKRDGIEGMGGWQGKGRVAARRPARPRQKTNGAALVQQRGSCWPLGVPPYK